MLKRKLIIKYLICILLFIITIFSFKIYEYYKYLIIINSIKSIQKYTTTSYPDYYHRMLLYDYYQKQMYKKKINKFLNKKSKDETTNKLQSAILFGISFFEINNNLKETVKSYLSSDSKNKFLAAIEALIIWEKIK